MLPKYKDKKNMDLHTFLGQYQNIFL